MNQKIYKLKKAYFQKFSWFQFYIYKLCTIMFIGIAPQTRRRHFMQKTLSFHKEIISA